jgi:hypothetical protein
VVKHWRVGRLFERDAWFKSVLKAALTIAFTIQSPALAGLNYLAEVPGLAVIDDQVIRPDGVSVRLLIARIDPDRMFPEVLHAGPDGHTLRAERLDTAHPPSAARTPWQVIINASYFDEYDLPIFMLRDRSRQYAQFRKGRGAVFSCRDKHCSIRHARDFDPRQDYDIVVQSTPRILASGKATEGVKNSGEIDSRAGLAITEDGTVLAFATEPQFWRGLSFDQVRDHLAVTHGVRDILMLDGGTSTQMKIIIGQNTYKSGMLYRDVPFRISLMGTGD